MRSSHSMRGLQLCSIAIAATLVSVSAQAGLGPEVFVPPPYDKPSSVILEYTLEDVLESVHTLMKERDWPVSELSVRPFRDPLAQLDRLSGARPYVVRYRDTRTGKFDHCAVSVKPREARFRIHCRRPHQNQVNGSSADVMNYSLMGDLRVQRSRIQLGCSGVEELTPDACANSLRDRFASAGCAIAPQNISCKTRFHEGNLSPHRSVNCDARVDNCLKPFTYVGKTGDGGTVGVARRHCAPGERLIEGLDICASE